MTVCNSFNTAATAAKHIIHNLCKPCGTLQCNSTLSSHHVVKVYLHVMKVCSSHHVVKVYLHVLKVCSSHHVVKVYLHVMKVCLSRHVMKKISNVVMRNTSQIHACVHIYTYMHTCIQLTHTTWHITQLHQLLLVQHVPKHMCTHTYIHIYAYMHTVNTHNRHITQLHQLLLVQHVPKHTCTHTYIHTYAYMNTVNTHNLTYNAATSTIAGTTRAQTHV